MSTQEERADKLRRIVENAQGDEYVFAMIFRLAFGILTHLGLPEEFVAQFLSRRQGEQIANLYEYEEKLHTDLANSGAFGKLEQRMSERALAWQGAVNLHLGKKFCPGYSLLDLGGGSGELALRIQGELHHLAKIHQAETPAPTVTIADTLDWRKVDLPFVQVTDNHVDQPDRAYNVVMGITTLHHTNDVPALVLEAFRLAKNYVIFIESVTESPFMFAYGAWIDWFYNHVIHYSGDPNKKINVPCHFMPVTGWEQLIWRLTGLTPTVSQSLGVFQFLNPESHHLFVYNTTRY